jgi:hypothetical protein
MCDQHTGTKIWMVKVLEEEQRITDKRRIFSTRERREDRKQMIGRNGSGRKCRARKPVRFWKK